MNGIATRVVVLLVDAYARCAYWRLAMKFRRNLKYRASLALPRTYQEKLQWRKIFDRNPLFVTFCDKLACKAYIAERFPEIAVVPTLWQGTSARDIPDEILNGDVVIKQSNASGRCIFVNGGGYDRAEIERTVGRWLTARAYGRNNGEWAYAQSTPKVFVEEQLVPPPGERLVELKFICANGKCIYAQLITARSTPEWAYGHFLPDGQPSATRTVARPGKERARLPDNFKLPPEFHTARRFAERLSAGVDQVRCDFMIAGGRIYFSEMTVYHGSGFDGHTDDSLLGPAGALWDIRNAWFLTTPQRGWRGLYASALKTLIDEMADCGTGRMHVHREMGDPDLGAAGERAETGE